MRKISEKNNELYHYVKSVQIRSFSSPYTPVFGLNTEIYEVNLRILFKYGKIRARKNFVFGHFSHSVLRNYDP